MNDRCATGTGRFLEVVGRQLDMAIQDLGKHALDADNPAGVQLSIASRIVSMAGRRIADPVVFTGGVALIPGMDRLLQDTLVHPVTVA